ncbi:MAG: archease [Candidatus Brocadiae bacterium]|nr:archease [Candidatus Brocadiia bacterium]
MGYEILDHTADVGLSVRANDKQELFAIAAKGITSLLVSGEIQEKESIEISLEGQTIEEIFHDWLSEINYMFLVKQKVFHRFVILELSSLKLKAMLYGESCDPQRHSYLNEIKAVTYHQIQVKEEAGQWCARVYFDL